MSEGGHRASDWVHGKSLALLAPHPLYPIPLPTCRIADRLRRTAQNSLNAEPG